MFHRLCWAQCLTKNGKQEQRRINEQNNLCCGRKIWFVSIFYKEKREETEEEDAWNAN